MSSKLAAGKTLELVEGLRSAVQDFSARADKLNEDFRHRTAQERLRSQNTSQEKEQELSAALAEEDAAFEAAKAAAHAKFEQRKARVGKAFQSSKHQGLQRVENRTGARKYELQKRMLQGERDRDAALAAAGKAFEDFRAELATELGKVAELEGTAQRAFRGYGQFRRIFFKAYETAEAPAQADPGQAFTQMRASSEQARSELDLFTRVLLLRLLRPFPAWAVVPVAIIVALLPRVLPYLGNSAFTMRQATFVLAGLGLISLVRFVVKLRALPRARTLSQALARARRLHDLGVERSEVRREEEAARRKAEYETLTRTVEQELKRSLAEAAEARVSCRMESDERTVRVNARNEKNHRDRLERLEREHSRKVQGLKAAAEVRMRALADAAETRQRKASADHEATWRTMENEWKAKTEPIFETIRSSNQLATELFPPWDAPAWKNWRPPARFVHTARFAQLNADLEKLCGALPKDKRLALPGPGRFSLPLCLAYPEQGSILFETDSAGHDQAIAALNNIILRLLSVAPAGRLNFTVLDPVGLGQNFAGVMHLADFEEQLINNRIWTQSGQIEQKLADLNEHMEKVIQMYLRNEYATIAEYNEQAGVIAEKYLFLVVADFPVHFTDVAARRLLSIAASGARCGVYTLIHWDKRQPLPQDFIPDELRKNSVCLSSRGAAFILTGKALPGLDLVLDAPPTDEFATEFVLEVGKASRDSSRVEVPFSHVTPPEAEVWSEDTTTELRVPIGRTGATKLQYLAIGKGTCQHGLVAGKTGSGKSTLFHVIITNLALWCSPEQVEFYLVDFKKGVEFKCYAARRLPHARVVAIESDREFGLSVLQRVDDELKRRGDLFRALGVQDIPGYKRAGGKEPIPRTLLLIDEFQEFFVEDDKIGQIASLLLDRLVRQGRAFGIHVLLGSQTLGGAYTVARTTLGQMVIRIALQCNEADAYLIMDDSNPAPRLLSRPGEGIYNDMAGALEGNSPFQVVWLPEAERDTALARVRARADQNGQAYGAPVVFEGNAPADVRENNLLSGLLDAKSLQPVRAARMWFGAPNSIKGPTEAVFERQAGNNLLIVGQNEESVLALFSISLVCLAAQFPVGAARIILLDASAPGSPPREYLERLLRAIPHPVELPKPGELPELMSALAAEMKSRAEAADAGAGPPVFLIIHGLQRYARLRYEEEFSFSTSEEAQANPGLVLNNLVCEGARLGFHVIAACDTYNNVSRYLSRKAVSEFEMRVLFQMSATDSASLIDNPKASMLGLHRALFFNAQQGYLETFRPYALPGTDWVEQAGRNLARLLQK